MLNPLVNPLVPIFALQDRARRRDVEQARDAGVTDVITTPISPRTIVTKLKAAPRPFIVAPDFFGPTAAPAAAPPGAAPSAASAPPASRKWTSFTSEACLPGERPEPLGYAGVFSTT